MALDVHDPDTLCDGPFSSLGGYAFANDEKFGSAFANAGGVQVTVNLRGEVDPAMVTLAPAWRQGSEWVEPAVVPERNQG